MSVKCLLERHVLPLFPPSTFVMAYGSGVFAQKSYTTKDKPVIDLIIGVAHAETWHEANLQKNPDHYSGLKYLPRPARVMQSLQDNFPARLYYNTLVPVSDFMIKYGVISDPWLHTDLKDWSEFYCAGRLQKPCLILEKDSAFESAQKRNLEAAVITSCLLLPESFTKYELYLQIASLSYMGDPRMKYNFENPNKVKNIVDNNVDHFHMWYRDTLQSLEEQSILRWNEKEEFYMSSCHDPSTRSSLCQALPKSLSKSIDQSCTKESIQAGLAAVVQRASHAQTMKGILTAGVTKSILYGLAKLKKSFRK